MISVSYFNINEIIISSIYYCNKNNVIINYNLHKMINVGRVKDLVVIL